MTRILDFSICDPTVLLDTHVKYKKIPTKLQVWPFKQIRKCPLEMDKLSILLRPGHFLTKSNYSLFYWA